MSIHGVEAEIWFHLAAKPGYLLYMLSKPGRLWSAAIPSSAWEFL